MLHSPHDLNDAAKIREMFDFLRSRDKTAGNDLWRPQEQEHRLFLAQAQKESDLQFVLERLPERYLRIFRGQALLRFPLGGPVQQRQRPIKALDQSPLKRLRGIG